MPKDPGKLRLICQSANKGQHLTYEPKQGLYQCPSRGENCRFVEQPDGSLLRYGEDCGRDPLKDITILDDGD